MAITDNQKVDYLFKKIGYSVAKTDMANVKSPSNESIASPLAVRGGSIWTQSDVIPTAIPASNSSVVVLYNDSLGTTVQTTNDGTASANRTWKTNLTDWIDASYGSTYQVKVYLATTGNAAPQTYGTQLFADGTGNDEWFFDYTAGVLNFIGNALPSGSFTGKSIFVSGARYVGSKGLGNLGNVTFNGNISADEIYEGGYRVLTANSNISINGSVVGYGNASNIYVTLTSTGVTPGTYGAADDEYTDKIPKITVDAEGRITNIANVTLTQVANVSFNDTNIYSNSSITISSLNNANIYLNATGTGVVQFSGGDALGLPTGDSSTRPANPEIGYFRYNTDNDIIEYWDGTDWASPGIQPISSQVLTPDGVGNTFVLSDTATPESLLVMINGTLQQPLVSYDVSGNVITFSEVPLTSDVIEVRRIASGATTISGLALGPTSVNLTAGNVNVAGNIVPTANVTYSLGSETNWWKDIYLSGGTIYLGGITLKDDGGTLKIFEGNTSTPVKLQADDPVDLQDVVTLSYLNTQLSSLDTTIIQADDSSIQIIDTGTSAGNIVIAVDGGNIATVGANKVSIQVPLEVTGNISAEKITIGTISLTSQQVVLGSNAGNIESGVNTISVGTNAGQKSQLLGAIAIGSGAGANIQNFDSIAIGTNSGTNSQGSYAIAIGQQSGRFTQGTDAVALGRNAGETSQGVKSTALGYSAGGNTQGNAAVAVGDEAGAGWQGNAAVAIGSGAGRSYQGSYSVALGYRAGYLNQPNNTIILNASGSAVNGITEQTNSFYVNPIRNATGNVGTLQYNSTTKEVTYHTDIAAGTVAANYFTWANTTSIITTLSTYTTESNTAMKGYVDSKISANITALVNGAPGTLDTLNELAAALGSDANLSVTLTNSIANVASNVATLTANAGAQAGSLATITANLGAVSGSLATLTSNAAVQSGDIATLYSNAAVQAGIIASLTNYANANVTAYLPTHSGNIGASTLNLSANITFSSTNVPHRIRGDFSTSYTSVSLKNKVFFQSSGATDDTYIRVLGGTSGGIGGIQLYGTYDPDNSTVLQLDSVPGLQSRIVSYANGTATAVPLRISAGSTDVVIGTSGLVEVSGEISTTDLTVTNTISGTANNALNLGGTPAAQYLLTHATAVTASGASVNFTSIPSWAKRITVMFSGVSTSGSSNMLVRLGTSASVEATGYLGSQSGADAVGGIVASLETTGFRVSVATASTSIIHGTITLTYIGSNIWTATGITSRSNAAYITYLGGSKTLASTLTRVQITMSNGTDTFDAGTINIMYE